MPHERIYDTTHGSAPSSPNESAGTVYLEVSWSGGPTPLSEHDEPEGWVQLRTVSERVPARIANPNTAEVTRLTADWLREHFPALLPTEDEYQTVAAELADLTAYAFGEEFTGYAVTLDRPALNRAIRVQRRARDKAHGADA